ncbi:ion channel protein [Shigella flexneri]
MTVNIALAVAIGARLSPRVNRMEWTTLASAGTIGALFGTPVAAALIFSQTLNGSSEVPLWDRLFAPLMAAAAGALTTGLFFHPHFSLPIAHYGQMEMTDILSGAIVAAIAIAAGMVAVWCLPRLHAMMHQMKNPVLVLGIGGFILGILGVIGGPVSLFKGLDEMQQMVANHASAPAITFCWPVIKLAALVVAAASGFRGGRIFPAAFVGVALGSMLHEHVPAVPAAKPFLALSSASCRWDTRRLVKSFYGGSRCTHTTLLPLLCIVTLPAWLLLAGKPMMMVNCPKQQPPHDNRLAKNALLYDLRVMAMIRGFTSP